MNSSEPKNDQIPSADEAPQPTRQEEHAAGRTRVSGVWVGMIAAAIVMVFLLIFILQNPESADIEFLAFDFSLPLGVALLLAALAGTLIVAIPGVARVLQLRRKLRS